MKDIDALIELLEFLRLYCSEKKFVEEPAQLQQDLAYAETHIPSIIQILQLVQHYSTFIKIFAGTMEQTS